VTPFDVLVRNVPDSKLGPLLTRLGDAGLDARLVGSADGSPVEVRGDGVRDLPLRWEPVRELDGQSYRWPKYRERYIRYRIFVGNTNQSGTVQIALGEAPRAAAWGRERKYVIAFLTSGSPQIPLVEFLEVDDYEQTHELIAIVRGSDGGKRMYDPHESLPASYEPFRIETYRERVDFPRAWNKLAVIAHEDDTTAMLNHALLQARRRGDL
jgi:hypothetical protein